MYIKILKDLKFVCLISNNTFFHNKFSWTEVTDRWENVYVTYVFICSDKIPDINNKKERICSAQI